ncbi:helix-turn-helix domain-containing protein [Halosimplex pelagicum]|uniref:Helix-turn-helix domain-containing protein n=1 Tax=Halosimplex pelagicum TaxID=869886 RepID=A0A7D5SV61_9EURY|nr:helix-turn-helix domain-containing protein [Halosimplex pelagicum]QLH81987.1 helix-turn-helix domain-containing protein [Halosimplex pelagicum]
MKRLHVRVTPPTEELLPVHRAISATSELGDAVLLSGGEDSDDPTELFSIRGSRETVLAALGDQSGIRSVNLLSAEDGETYVYVREVGQERTIADAFTADTLVVTLPIQFRTNGSVELTVLGSGSDLQAALGTVRELADVTVLKVRDGWSDQSRDSLTERQRTVLHAAYEAGYYDYPRTTTQDKVASAVAVTGSTVAEHLRNAEATLVQQALDTESASE